MRIEVVVWNIRNLTRHYRKGGWDGVSSERRVERVLYTLREAFRNTHEVQPGLVLLMETGTDAGEYVVPTLLRLNDDLPSQNWQGYVSAETGHYAEREGGDSSQCETYTVLVNQKVFTKRPIELEVMPAEGNYRGGCIVNYLGKPLISCIHAPSPKHRLEARLGVIKNFAEQSAARAEEHTLGVVLCGDFNLKEPELPRLAEELGELKLELSGPLDEEESPLPTSLKIINSQLQLGEYESQPYDLVWNHPGTESGPRVVPGSVSLLRPVFTPAAEERHIAAAWQWVLGEIDTALTDIEKTLPHILEGVERRAGEGSSSRRRSDTRSDGESASVPGNEAWEDVVSAVARFPEEFWPKLTVSDPPGKEPLSPGTKGAMAMKKISKSRGPFEPMHSSVATDLKQTLRRVATMYETLRAQKDAWLPCTRKFPGEKGHKLANDILDTYSNFERCLRLMLGAVTLQKGELSMDLAASASSVDVEEALGVRLLMSDHLGVRFQMEFDLDRYHED